MAAGIETFEFTIEDILLMHKDWITKLFIDDEKSEVEIVGLLYERHLVVTPAQIHKCLLDWDLMPPPQTTSNNSSTTSMPQANPGYWMITSPESSMSAAMDIFLRYTRTGLEPEDLDSYTTRPLPSLPANTPTSSTTSTTNRFNKRKDCGRESNGRLNLTCYLGKDTHAMERPLGSFAEGSTSPLEIFLQDEQAHERLAMGLDRVPRLFCNEASTVSRKSVHTAPVARNKRDQEKKNKRRENDEQKRM